MNPSAIGVYGPWAASHLGEGPAALSFRNERFTDVELISAFDLDDAATEKLVTALKKRLGTDVNVTTSVDQSLIGGVLVRAGDTVIDGSVRGRLNRLAEQLNS